MCYKAPVPTPAIRPRDLPLTKQSGVGYVPAYLDKSIADFITSCEQNIGVVQKLAGQIQDSLTRLDAFLTENSDEDKGDALRTAIALASIFERVARGTASLTRSADELSRLRSFASGGPDSRPDLTVRSEIELRAMLFHAVKGIGCSIIDSEGKPLEIVEGDIVN